MNYQIRPATRKELETILEWAAQEGWNPGLYDGDAFYEADPKGFLLGFLDNEPIASISSIAYNNTFGFLGLYIVKPEYRSKGYGIQIWSAAIKHLPTQNIGLDGVLAQQENYKKSGFKLAYRTIRYEGSGIRDHVESSNIIPLSAISFKQLLHYDAQVFPTERSIFLREWIKQPESLAMAYQKDGNLLGYGVVRTCRLGFKVGPLFANNSDIVSTLLQNMRSFVGEKNLIFLDAPEINKTAATLAEQHGMKPIFETVRMYTKDIPNVDFEKIYGVTTLELG